MIQTTGRLIASYDRYVEDTGHMYMFHAESSRVILKPPYMNQIWSAHNEQMCTYITIVGILFTVIIMVNKYKKI